MAQPTTPLGRRTFLAAGAGTALATGCHSLGPGTNSPLVGRFVSELTAAIDNLPKLQPFARSAKVGEDPAILAAADKSLQAVMHALMTSGNILDLEPEQRKDQRVLALAEAAREPTNQACIGALWEAEDMLEDPNDELLASLDADPSEILAAAQMMDEAAVHAGLPKRWRRRLQKTTEDIAWRVKRQSARAVLGDAVQQAYRLLDRAKASQKDPLALALLSLDGPSDTAYANLDLAQFAQGPALTDLDLGRFSGPPSPSPPPLPPPLPPPVAAGAPAPAGDPTAAPPTLAPAVSPTVAPTVAPPDGAAPLGSFYDPEAAPQGQAVARGRNNAITELVLYPGFQVRLYLSRGNQLSGVFAGIDKGRIVLLHSAYRRIKVPVAMVQSFSVGNASPQVLADAYKSATAMTIAGAILVPVGLAGAVFTFGTSLFLFCPGIVILIVGLIRLRQTRRGYHYMMKNKT